MPIFRTPLFQLSTDDYACLYMHVHACDALPATFILWEVPPGALPSILPSSMTVEAANLQSDQQVLQPLSLIHI